MLQVVGGAARDGSGNPLLRNSTAKGDDQLLFEPLEVVEHLLFGEGRHEATCISTRHDGDLSYFTEAGLGGEGDGVT